MVVLLSIPIYISFQWHMHQPIYVPYYDAVTTIYYNGVPSGPSFSFSLSDVWTQRVGPYTSWPTDAIEYGLSLPYLGAQVSLSGSLIENLNNLEYNGWNSCLFCGWKDRYVTGINYTTSGGNPRLYPVLFPYHHPVLPLLPDEDVLLHLLIHKELLQRNFNITTRGLFPPECVFAEWIIPPLREAGIEWVIIDNIHLSRTLEDYAWNGGTGVVEPNRADVLNGSLSSWPNSGWVNLHNVWAPEPVAAGFAHRPHYAKYIDPETGESKKIIVVPAECYMGNEDGRGGFGALDYEQVMGQLFPYNTDPSHPVLVLLHHDGDNYGGGTDSYYHSNFENFVSWATEKQDSFVPVTIEDYLSLFPPDPSDVVHVEPGGWIGSGCLDPQFSKWLGYSEDYSPDLNSWAVIVAGHNWVWTANLIEPYTSISDIIDNTGNATSQAFHDYLASHTSCYFYWEGSIDDTIWNANPTRAVNLAIDHIRDVVSGGPDNLGPSIFLPQRTPYNPGGTEFGTSQPRDFEVWTLIYDLSGIKEAKLFYRADEDGVVDSLNCIYSWGTWDSLDMSWETWDSRTDPAPYYKAKRYYAVINGRENVLYDYYVKAVDSLGNQSKSRIMHVYVGPGGGGGSVSWTPSNPTPQDTIRIEVQSDKGGYLHWGVNGWKLPPQDYWPPGTTVWEDSCAVETPLSGSSPLFYIDIGPFINGDVGVVDFVIHFEDDTWDNNNGNDYHIVIQGVTTYVMDGELDPVASKISENGGASLYAHFDGENLYLATEAPGGTEDRFIILSLSPDTLVPSPWAKSGKVGRWDFFLGGEGTNGWSGWFDENESIVSFPESSGTYLEGVINLEDAFGHIPQVIYLAVGIYETGDGGDLIGQVPQGTGSPQDIEESDFYAFQLSGIRRHRTSRRVLSGPSLIDVLGRKREKGKLPPGIYFKKVEGGYKKLMIIK